MQADDLVKPVASFFNVHRRHFFRRCRNGRLFVATFIGRFSTHLFLRKSEGIKPSATSQILKKYSGIPTMYFRLNNHRSTILMGSAVIQSSKNIMTWYRVGPSAL